MTSTNQRSNHDRVGNSPLRIGVSHGPLVILGTGYAGRVVYHQALMLRRTVLAASRTPETNLADLPLDQRFVFDLNRRDTWAASSGVLQTSRIECEARTA